jgi:5-methylcytosine-specific restriction endonuclease McrA
MFTRTLILNSFYRPHEIVDWKDAVTRMFKGSVEVLAQYDEVIAHLDQRTLQTFPELKRALRQVTQTDVESIDIKVPAVAVLRRKVAPVKSGVKFSKLNVCQRDEFKCQYCSTELPISKLNYDHVIPRFQGGKTVWENIVMSCYPCNDKKRNRTPDQAGMKLLKVPVKPAVLPMSGPVIVPGDDVPEEWGPYITLSA